MSKSNLYEETLELLSAFNKTPSDVLAVGSEDYGWTTWDNFEEIAKKTDYYQGFGLVEVAKDLKVVGKDWWLDRREYDGSEWWEFNKIPTIKNMKKIKALTTKQAEELDNDYWGEGLLSDINGENKGEE